MSSDVYTTKRQDGSRHRHSSNNNDNNNYHHNSQQNNHHQHHHHHHSHRYHRRQRRPSLNADLFDDVDNDKRDDWAKKPLTPDSLWKELQFQRHLRNRMRRNMQARARVVDSKGRQVTLAERIIRQKLIRSRTENNAATETEIEEQPSTSNNTDEPPPQQDKKETFINLLQQYIQQREAEAACSSRLIEEISEAKQSFKENVVFKGRISSSGPARDAYSSSNISLGDSATNYNAKFGAAARRNSSHVPVDIEHHSSKELGIGRHHQQQESSSVLDRERNNFEGSRSRSRSVEKSESFKKSNNDNNIIVLDESELLTCIDYGECVKNTEEAKHSKTGGIVTKEQHCLEGISSNQVDNSEAVEGSNAKETNTSGTISNNDKGGIILDIKRNADDSCDVNSAGEQCKDSTKNESTAKLSVEANNTTSSDEPNLNVKDNVDITVTTSDANKNYDNDGKPAIGDVVVGSEQIENVKELQERGYPIKEAINTSPETAAVVKPGDHNQNVNETACATVVVSSEHQEHNREVQGDTNSLANSTDNFTETNTEHPVDKNKNKNDIGGASVVSSEYLEHNINRETQNSGNSVKNTLELDACPETIIVKPDHQTKSVNFNESGDNSIVLPLDTKEVSKETTKEVDTSNVVEANATAAEPDSQEDVPKTSQSQVNLEHNENQSHISNGQVPQGEVNFVCNKNELGNAEIMSQISSTNLEQRRVQADTKASTGQSGENNLNDVSRNTRNSTKSDGKEDSHVKDNVHVDLTDDKKSEKDSAIENSDEEETNCDNASIIKSVATKDESTDRAYQFSGFSLERAYTLPELVPVDLNDIFIGHRDLSLRERGQQLTLISSPKGSNTTITSHILPSLTYKSCLPLPPIPSSEMDEGRESKGSRLKPVAMNEATVSCPNMSAYRDNNSNVSSDADSYTTDEEIEDSGFLDHHSSRNSNSNPQNVDKKMHETISCMFKADCKRQNIHSSFEDMADRDKRVIGLYNELKCFSLLQRSKENITIAMTSRPNGLNDLHIEWGRKGDDLANNHKNSNRIRKRGRFQKPKISRYSRKIYDPSKDAPRHNIIINNNSSNRNIAAPSHQQTPFTSKQTPWEIQARPHEFIYLRDLSFSHYVAKAVYENRLQKYLECGHARDGHVMKKRPRPRIKMATDVVNNEHHHHQYKHDAYNNNNIIVNNNDNNNNTMPHPKDNSESKLKFPVINKSQNVTLIGLSTINSMDKNSGTAQSKSNESPDNSGTAESKNSVSPHQTRHSERGKKAAYSKLKKRLKLPPIHR